MIVFNINHSNYKMLLGDLAAALHIPYQGDDFLLLAPPAGNGIIKVLSLFDELQVMLVDTSFGDKLVTARTHSSRRFYILHFDDVFISDTARLTVDKEVLEKSNTRHAVARLTSNIFDNVEEIPAGLHIKSVKILMQEQWLKKYLGLGSDAALLQKYLSLKTASFDMEKLDASYLELMNSLWSVHKMEPLNNIFLQNRVTLLIERFFSRLYAKIKLPEETTWLTDEDMERLLEVKQILVNDFTKIPPTIGEISRMVSMGNTRLKKKFKTVFGDSIYSYYQKQRMLKAKELLTYGRLRVNEVAEAIGYQNTSNFISAFKKQFELSPGDIAKH